MEDHCIAVGAPVETANETIPQRGLVLPLTATFFGAEPASALREPHGQSGSRPSKSCPPSADRRSTASEPSARGAATAGAALEPRGDRA
ncbi:hypothetical protein [Natrinema versiforme]|uniref:Uncharacterized protein n=1 Tax=Natrinema versiforme JCM 10478 TaxID=1227496 RepID=L9XYJ8_9EURY|nr:hypothetical protein [Natrinema versiforme]ELY66885.1 hypothetical protein C489_12612 [Natrinema versiforme JCM 10478]